MEYTQVVCQRVEACYLCAFPKNHSEQLVRAKDYESHLGEFDVRVCRNCGLGYTDPSPTPETSQYLYHLKESSDFDMIRHSIIDDIKNYCSARFLKSLMLDKKIHRILDYGAGNGRFALSAARLCQYAVVDAVDYQQSPPASFLKHTPSNLKYYSVDQFLKNKHQYDLIILRHVLEHSHDPIQLLKKLASHLSPEGLLYLEVPNIDSGCAKVFGKFWRAYNVPRHIFHYSMNSLTRIINASGLQAVVYKREMPLMGNMISIFMNQNINKPNIGIQFLGAFFHPIQLLIEYFFRSSTCISAKCALKKCCQAEGLENETY